MLALLIVSLGKISSSFTSQTHTTSFLNQDEPSVKLERYNRNILKKKKLQKNQDKILYEPTEFLLKSYLETLDIETFEYKCNLLKYTRKEVKKLIVTFYKCSFLKKDFEKFLKNDVTKLNPKVFKYKKSNHKFKRMIVTEAEKILDIFTKNSVHPKRLNIKNNSMVAKGKITKKVSDGLRGQIKPPCSSSREISNESVIRNQNFKGTSSNYNTKKGKNNTTGDNIETKPSAPIFNSENNNPITENTKNLTKSSDSSYNSLNSISGDESMNKKSSYTSYNSLNTITGDENMSNKPYGSGYNSLNTITGEETGQTKSSESIFNSLNDITDDENRNTKSYGSSYYNGNNVDAIENTKSEEVPHEEFIDFNNNPDAERVEKEIDETTLANLESSYNSLKNVYRDFSCSVNENIDKLEILDKVVEIFCNKYETNPLDPDSCFIFEKIENIRKDILEEVFYYDSAKRDIKEKIQIMGTLIEQAKCLDGGEIEEKDFIHFKRKVEECENVFFFYVAYEEEKEYPKIEEYKIELKILFFGLENIEKKEALQKEFSQLKKIYEEILNDYISWEKKVGKENRSVEKSVETDSLSKTSEYTNNLYGKRGEIILEETIFLNSIVRKLSKDFADIEKIGCYGTNPDNKLGKIKKKYVDFQKMLIDFKKTVKHVKSENGNNTKKLRLKILP